MQSSIVGQEILFRLLASAICVKPFSVEIATSVVCELFVDVLPNSSRTKLRPVRLNISVARGIKDKKFVKPNAALKTAT